MKYDFDSLLDRSDEGSIKWDCAKNELPMWVADMDFPIAKTILEAMQERLSHPSFGYSSMPESWAKAYVDYFKRHFNVALNEEGLLFSLGIIPSLTTCIRAFSLVGDEIVLMSPVYNIFDHSAENSYRKVVRSGLINKNETYSIDFSDLEKRLSSPKAKILVLCNPHNPVGKVWSKEELTQIALLCKKHHVLVVSDEVHGPINGGDKPYIPYCSIPEAKDNCITLLAPTKAYNIAGVQTSACYVENPSLREKLAFELNAGEVAEGNFLSYLVSEAALNRADDWLEQMNAYVHANYLYCKKRMQEELPNAYTAPLEATYLMWVDISSYSQDDVIFCRKLRKETGLWVTPGSTYGEEGKGHIRINLATQRDRVVDGINRLIGFCCKK